MVHKVTQKHGAGTEVQKLLAGSENSQNLQNSITKVRINGLTKLNLRLKNKEKIKTDKMRVVAATMTILF